MNLITDIGNTCVKLALFEGDKVVHTERSDIHQVEESIKKIVSENSISNVIVSSVAGDPSEIILLLRNAGCNVHHLTGKSKYPFRSQYTTPETIGVDRLAAAAGAVKRFGNADILIIDAGSAVTFDIISDFTFKGGAISPGMEMRFKALNKFTQRLPLCSFSENITFPATSTHDAITAGVERGLTFEINEYIRMFSGCCENPVIILTGGDSILLSRLIDFKCVCIPDLVIEGLNYLLECNLK